MPFLCKQYPRCVIIKTRFVLSLIKRDDIWMCCVAWTQATSRGSCGCKGGGCLKTSTATTAAAATTAATTVAAATTATTTG